MLAIRTSRLFALLLAALLVAGCASTTRLVRNDIYTRNVIFTVPATSDYPMLATSFTESTEEQDATILIEGVLEFHGLEKVSQFAIKTLGVEAVVADIGQERNVDEVIRALSSDNRVQSVQSVRPFKLLAYNDPYFSLQNTVNGDRIENIHEISTGKNVSVGIIDTGVDRWHPELAGNIVYTNNLVAHDQQSFDRDEHGTAVAGVIGSAANNDLGIVGVAPDVRLMVFKACHQEITSRRTACDSVSIIKALNDALAQHPDILNLSLSGPKDGIIENLIRVADRQGMVVVAAVDEKRGKDQSFPANMPEVIAVGTSLNLGNSFDGVVLAPGTDMLTTAPGAAYGFKSGSSMATAYVSGIAALMKEKMPSLTRSQIYAFLRDSSRLDENELPVVDMCVAVNEAANTTQPSCERARSMAVIEVKDEEPSALGGEPSAYSGKPTSNSTLAN